MYADVERTLMSAGHCVQVSLWDAVCSVIELANNRTLSMYT
jgi:hypothetical protein